MNKTIVLGAEYDETLFASLKELLQAEGAKVHGEQWGIVGSQEVSIWKVQLRGKRVIVEAETYLGLSLRGPASLVDEIAVAVAEHSPA